MILEPIAQGLFTSGDHPQLIGGKHKESGKIAFPIPSGLEGDLYEEILLPRDGTLWSWTVQRFRPKSPPYLGPEEFTPFALGYVDLGGLVIVEARLTGIAFDALRVGMPVSMTVETFRTETGTDYLNYAFTAAEGSAR